MSNWARHLATPLEQRVTGSYNKNVLDGGHHFRAAKDAQTLRDIVIPCWEMLPAAENTVAARGFEALRVDTCVAICHAVPCSGGVNHVHQGKDEAPTGTRCRRGDELRHHARLGWPRANRTADTAQTM